MAKFLTLDIIRDLRGLVWLNTLSLLSIFFLYVVNVQGHVLIVAVIALGAAFYTANHLFINSYVKEKIETRLTSSYEELKESMSFDDLTGLYNRRAGMARLHEEFARARRSGGNLTLAMVDIDNFKKVNDMYGHLTGDHVLKDTAATIKQWLRENDIVFRYGGEEFLIILPETEEGQAFTPLERLRAKLSGHIITNGHHIKSSVSIGVASPLETEEGEMSVIHRADQALYTAKSMGRNRVICNTETPLLIQ
ncbi:MAG: GGDEF domain-containing protein [Thermodesulfobacteriota bacterium]